MSTTIVLYEEEQAGRITGTLSIDGESLTRHKRAYLVALEKWAAFIAACEQGLPVPTNVVPLVRSAV